MSRDQGPWPAAARASGRGTLLRHLATPPLAARRLRPRVLHPPAPPQRIAEEFAGGFDPDQLMHIWRRHAQRGPVARKGKWAQEEDEALLKVGRWLRLQMAAGLRAGARAAPPLQVAAVLCGVPAWAERCRRLRLLSVGRPGRAGALPSGGPPPCPLRRRLAPQAMALHGRKWSLVARLVPGRTDVQCRERYINVLDPGGLPAAAEECAGGVAWVVGCAAGKMRPPTAARIACLPRLPALPAGVATYRPWNGESDRRLLALATQHTQVGVPGRAGHEPVVLPCLVVMIAEWQVPCSPHTQLAMNDPPCARCVPPHTRPALQPDGKIKWSAVAAGLPGRTDKQCSIRYKALTSG